MEAKQPVNLHVEASAPGRMDVMGGIADYSGSLVMQMPIKEQTTVKIQFTSQAFFSIESEGETFEISLTALLPEGIIDYAHARNVLKNTPGGDWAAYIIGSILVFCKEKQAQITGANIYVSSAVPLGKGVSSSAALEVAVMRALWKAYTPAETDITEIPLLAQKAENLIVGAPCGIMDQMASHLGRPGHLLPILCQPAQVSPPVAIPEQVYFIGIDSGVRHSVGGASYGDVRVGAYMGYTILALHAGANPAAITAARTGGNRSDLPWGGYLANIPVAEFERLKYLLPAEISGAEFKQKYSDIIDPISVIEEGKTYAVYYPARHPVYEHFRVNLFAELLANAGSHTALEQAGELMYQSHESYNDCKIGDRQTDILVAMARAAGTQSGILGAKITGGGSGGTVCMMCIGNKGLTSAQKIHSEYEQAIGKAVTFFEMK